MKKAAILLSVVVALMLAAAPAALACEKGACKGHGVVMCSCFDKQLGLSEDQQKKIDALRAKTDKKAAPLIKQLKAKGEEIHKLWAAAKPSRKKILAKKNQLYAIKKKLSVVKTDAHLALVKIITPEQRQTLMKEMKSCHHGQAHPAGCTCPHCKGKAHPAGCTCPDCQKKGATAPPAEKKSGGCKGCPGDCTHHKH